MARVGWMIGLACLCGCATLTAPKRQPPRVVALGSVGVDTANREILLSGRVNMTEGIIELVACGPGGKTHESIFILDVEPSDLQAALLLLGLKPGGGVEQMGVGQPVGPEVDVLVSWEVDGVRQELRAEETVYHRMNEVAMERTGWTFTGSAMYEGRFMASEEESLVATFWDPWAILNMPLPSGADDTLFVPNEDVLPPVGTPVEMRIVVR